MNATELDDIILDCLAVAAGTLKIGPLTNAVKMLGTTPDVTSITQASVRTKLDIYASDGTVFGRTHYSLEESIAETRVRQALRDGRYPSLVLVVSTHDRESDSQYYYASETDGPTLRNARLALMTDGVWGSYAYRVDTGTIATWFGAPFAPDLLDMLATRHRDRVVECLLELAFSHPLSCVGLEEYIAAIPAAEHSVGVVAGLARLALFRGDHATAVALLSDIPLEEAWYAHAQLALFQGDVKTAAKRYAKGLARTRADAGYSDAFGYSADAFFLPLAYFLAGGVARPKQARSLVRLAPGSVSSPWNGWTSLIHLVDRDVAVDSDSVHPFGVLLEALVAWWRGADLDAERLEDAALLADRAGWIDIALQLRCGPDGEGLVTLGEVQTDWERTLAAMQAVIGTPGKSGTPTSKLSKRIAWWVSESYGDVSLEPREQTRTKKGWSKGRKIALSRLSPSMPVATAEDAPHATIASRFQCSQPNFGSPKPL